MVTIINTEVLNHNTSWLNYSVEFITSYEWLYSAKLKTKLITSVTVITMVI